MKAEVPIISDSVKWQHIEFEPVEEKEQQKAVKEAMNALFKVLDEIDYFPEAEEWIERAACKLIRIDYAMYADENKRDSYFNKNPKAELEFVEKDDTVCIAYDRLIGGLPYSGELPKVFVLRSDRKPSAWAKIAMIAGGALLVLAGGHYLLNVFLPQHTDSDKDGLNDYDEQHTYKTDKNNPDSDNDKLLDGYNLTLANDSDLAKKFIDIGIAHKPNENGSLTFYGEKSLGTDPLKPNPSVSYALNKALDFEIELISKLHILNVLLRMLWL